MSDEIQFILYHLPDEDGKVQVVIKDETIWATQKAGYLNAISNFYNLGLKIESK